VSAQIVIPLLLGLLVALVIASYDRAAERVNRYRNSRKGHR
jgi:hypothetical protein